MASALAQSSSNDAVSSTVKIQFLDAKQRVYDGIIELPPSNERNGYAVIMLGGGVAAGLDWEVPPILSISGEWVRDGKTIADALLSRGFIVMRWRAIYRGDKKFAEDPLMADTPTFPESVEHARLALARFRAANVVEPDKIFLLGHSLGVRRATILLDENARLPGLVSLAGASLVSAKQGPLMDLVDDARANFVSLDKNKSGELEENEGADPNLSALKFPAGMNEFIVWRLSQKQDVWHESQKTDRFGFRFGCDVIRQHRTPTLAIVGTLDRRWLAEQYAWSALNSNQAEAKIDFRVFKDLGHQLGAEEPQDVVHPKFGTIANAKLGPIDSEVVDSVCRWLLEQVNTNRRD